MEEQLTGSDLKKYEMETIVRFNELDDLCNVYTSSKKLIAKFGKLGYKLIAEDGFGCSFECPKNLISFMSNKSRKINNKQKSNLKQNKDN